jgi:Protein of unknown function (DUF1800)
VTFDGNCEFIPMAFDEGFYLFFQGGDNCQCTLPKNNNAKVFFARIGGDVYRFEDMTSLVHNTPEEPDPQGCAAAQPHPVNIDHCIVVQGSCQGLDYTPSDQYILSCGSPGEVAAIPEWGAVLGTYSYDADDSVMSGSDSFPKTVWVNRTLDAKDQLRQRVAFALSEIWVADLKIGKETEPTLKFYDIFVRHAFGNYFDVMREVTYTLSMAEYLTYKGSKAYSYSGSQPDENFARELMQVGSPLFLCCCLSF